MYRCSNILLVSARPKEWKQAFTIVTILLHLFQIPGVSVPAPDVEPQAKKPKLDR